MSHPKIDCGIVIALREEFEGKPSLLPSFEHFFEIDDQGSQGTISFGFNDDLNIRRKGIVAIIQAMTPLEAYKTTRNLIETHEPRVMVNIGIAGSLASDIRLGDVIVANFADQYDYRGKAVGVPGSQSEFTFDWGGQPYFASEELFHRIQGMWTYLRPAHQQWMDQAGERLKRAVSVLL